MPKANYIVTLAVLAICNVGCGLFKFQVNTSSGSGAAGHGGDANARAQTHQLFVRMTQIPPIELAKKITELLAGPMHKVKVSPRGDGTQLVKILEGNVTNSYEDEKILWMAMDEILAWKAHNDYAKRYLEADPKTKERILEWSNWTEATPSERSIAFVTADTSFLKPNLCEIHYFRIGTPPAKIAKQCSEEIGGNFWSVKTDDLNNRDNIREAYLLGLAKALEDPSLTKEIMAALARTAGHRVRVFPYPKLSANKDRIYSMTLEEVPISNWSYHTIQKAIEWAKASSDKTLAGTLAKQLNKAERFRCTIFDSQIKQDYEGGAHYGTPYWVQNQTGLDTLRPQVELQSCANVAKGSQANLVAIVRKNAFIPTQIAGVIPDGEPFVVKNDLGVPLQKLANVKVALKSEY